MKTVLSIFCVSVFLLSGTTTVLACQGKDKTTAEKAMCEPGSTSEHCTTDQQV